VGVAGEVHAETIHAASRAEATRIIRRKYRELEPKLERSARRRNASGTPTMTALIDRFLAEGIGITKKWVPRRAVTQRKYTNAIRCLRGFYADRGDPPADRLENLDDFLRWRTAQKVLPTTLAQDRIVASALFDWAIGKRLLDHNPARQSPAPKIKARDPVILTDPELERLLEECTDPLLRFYVVVQAEAGLRCESEVLWLQWSDVNRIPGYLQVVSGRDGHQTKSDRTREVPITARLRQAFAEHTAAYQQDGTDSPWVFHDELGNRIRRLDDAFRRARNRARKSRRQGDVVVTATFKRAHDLRARRITTWLDEGQNVMHVMAWVGHEDVSTTQRYYKYCRKPLQPPRLVPTSPM
jgi:integrase